MKSVSCVQRRGLAAALVGVIACGCGALYPQMKTPVKAHQPGRKLEPGPPGNMLYLALRNGEVPRRTRDGRKWDEVGGEAPDTFVVVRVDEEELFRTFVHSNSFTPTWPHSPKKNYLVPPGATLKVELWEDNPIKAHAICSREVRNPHDEAQAGEVELRCETGGMMLLEVEPAHAKWGLGLELELRADAALIKHVLPHSPGERAELRSGEKITRVNGRPVRGMQEVQLRTAINSKAGTGLKLAVASASGGGERIVELKEGPIYWLKERR